ncbi:MULTISPECIES: TonB-dependent siderophore receptor [unclassified Variovorax]|uniref:TonB-dependent siderophore receptor n=1 Tax=unclassified Variovorax TaxID=663243 RepID=UPI002574DDBA|nr:MULTISPECIES: TonB-dependent siderophore receptor [unclassified Variovorax]MDM0089207.1 TonB-dependent siderophore receptor [Variovorax sp. J22G40]MDM0147280.1 TonB-dependent siderophore receptor [Variovorax sp. J2P1-31]
MSVARPPAFSPLALAVAAALFSMASAAQAQPQEATLAPVTVDARSAAPQADIAGFGDLPLKEVPLSATIVDSRQLQASGARRLADLTQFDASVTDAYNSAGYWDYLTVRGFVLDNRFNYRREGLPISAETAIALDNKERVEILRGTSGIQAGTSAPGGLVNYVVKRPTENDLREVRAEVSGRGSVLGAVDLGGRFGAERQFGYRLNVAAEDLKPRTFALDGQRHLASLAADWRITRDSVIEAEIEYSKKTQPSQNGFSLLGSTLPAPMDPRININNQPWSQPSVFEGLTGTLRFTQAINADWRWSAQIGQQRLKSDDRLAYAFGCSAEGNYDRYCSDGSFDLYDFRSENERRTQTAGSLNLKGQAMTGSVRHDLSIGLLASRVRNRFQDQTNTFLGTPGNIWGTAVVPLEPAVYDPNTNRDERSTELSLQDAIRWNTQLTTWVGLRHTRLDRDSVRTDGSRPTGYKDGITTPWLAISYALQPGLMAYASWGEGVESQIVPNKASQYANAGEALPALVSRQWEIGFKGGQENFNWQAAWFDISRPMTNIDACSNAGADCIGRNDGKAVHRGLELSAEGRTGPWRLGGSLTLIDAKREGSEFSPAINGQRPTNVPRQVLRAQAAYRIAAVPGLEVQGLLSHEGRRNVLPDGSITLPAWTRVDAALRYDTRMAGVATRWTLGIENVADKRYWKESPYQYGHVYLFPGAPRTLRLGVNVTL